MRRNLVLPLGFLLVIIFIFFRSVFLQGKVPIPTDTLVNLFNPYRDYYAAEFPRGVPYKNPLVGDPVIQQIPWRMLSTDQLKSLELPLWNPYQMAGYPLLGNIQSAPFYPLNILFFILPSVIAWTLLILSQQLLAGTFMFLYLRNRKLSVIASVFGSLAFSFCGYFISWLEWGTIVHTALWLPLILLAIDKAVSTHRTKWSTLLGVSVICSFLAGHLQTFIYEMVVAVTYTVLMYWHELSRNRNLIRFGLTAIVVSLITLPVWLPQLKFIGLSARNVDQTWQKDGWFIPFPQLFQFIAPDFFGNPATGNYWGVFTYGEFVGYLGISPLLFALLALFNKKKETWMWGTIAGLAIIFAFQNPLSELPYRLNIPFLSSTQPTRLIFVVDFALAILASFGLERFLELDKKALLRQMSTAFAIIIFGTLGFIFLIYQNINSQNIPIAEHNMVVPVVILIISFAFLFLGIFLPKQKRILFSLLIILITAADLLFFAGKFTPFSKTDYFYPQTKALTYLKQRPGPFRTMTTDRQILSPNITTMYHIESIDGYDPLYLMRFGQLAATINRNKADISSPFGFNRIIVPTEVNSKIVNLLGVKYVLTLNDRTDPQLKKVFQEGQTRIYENSQALPRAFFVETVKEVQSQQEAISSLFNPKFDLKSSAVVENAHLPVNSFGRGDVEILSYLPNRILIKTATDNTSFLVLTDSFYPTWKVSIDDKPSTIYLTDFAFRGVVVPKGIHTVEFKNTLL